MKRNKSFHKSICKTPFGEVLIVPSKFYGTDFYGKDIQVTKYPREANDGEL